MRECVWDVKTRAAVFPRDKFFLSFLLSNATLRDHFCAFQWGAQIQHLMSDMHRDKYQVCAYDNRGCGRSSVPSVFSSVEIMADDCIALLRHLGWSKVHLVGISMGGTQECLRALIYLSVYLFFINIPRVSGVDVEMRRGENHMRRQTGQPADCTHPLQAKQTARLQRSLPHVTHRIGQA